MHIFPKEVCAVYSNDKLYHLLENEGTVDVTETKIATNFEYHNFVRTYGTQSIALTYLWNILRVKVLEIIIHAFP